MLFCIKPFIISNGLIENYYSDKLINPFNEHKWTIMNSWLYKPLLNLKFVFVIMSLYLKGLINN